MMVPIIFVRMFYTLSDLHLVESYDYHNLNY